MNGNHARLLELKAENEKLRKDLTTLKRAVRALTKRLNEVTAELESLTEQ